MEQLAVGRQKTSSCILGASVLPLGQKGWDGNSHGALGLMSKIIPASGLVYGPGSVGKHRELSVGVDVFPRVPRHGLMTSAPPSKMQQ